VAYDAPDTENAQFCLPELTDIEQDTPIVDDIRFKGPNNDWTSFDTSSNCFVFSIAN